MSPLDAAILATAAEPEDAGVRLRLHEALAATDLHLILAREMAGDRAAPLIAETGDGPVAILFEGEERLAAFIDAPTPTLCLSGRKVMAMFAGQGVGLLLNPGTEGAELLLPPAVVDWAAEVLGAGVAEQTRRPAGFHAPALGTEAVAALADRLALMRDVIGTARLAGVRYDDGSRADALALTGVPKPAEAGVAAALAETHRLRAGGDAPLDILFAPTEAGLPAALRDVALRIALPAPAVPPEPSPRPGPGLDPARPPRLR